MSTTTKKKEVKRSNYVLNIFMIGIGAIYIFQGVIYYLIAYGVIADAAMMPGFIQEVFLAEGEGTAAFQGLMGESALMRLTLGAFSLIAGIGMFQNQEWAWGKAILLLSIIVVTTGGAVLAQFIDFGTINWMSWPWWIQLVSVAIAALGILWLLFTKERYS